MARITLATTPTETTPPAGQLSIYAKPDDNLYLKNSSGTEYLIFNAGVPGVGGYEVEQFTITEAQELAAEIELASTPTEPTRTLLFIDGAPATFYGLDFTVTGNVLSWGGTRLDGLLLEADLVRIVYF